MSIVECVGVALVLVGVWGCSMLYSAAKLFHEGVFNFQQDVMRFRAGLRQLEELRRKCKLGSAERN